MAPLAAIARPRTHSRPGARIDAPERISRIRPRRPPRLKTLPLAELVADMACPPALLRAIGTPAQESALAAGVAANPACPADALMRLAVHSHPYVSAAAAANPNCGPAALACAAGSIMTPTRAAAAANPNCGPATLDRLAADPTPAVRSAVASTIADGRMLRALAADQSDVVRTAAAANRRSGLSDALNSSVQTACTQCGPQPRRTWRARPGRFTCWRSGTVHCTQPRPQQRTRRARQRRCDASRPTPPPAAPPADAAPDASDTRSRPTPTARHRPGLRSAVRRRLPLSLL